MDRMTPSSSSFHAFPRETSLHNKTINDKINYFNGIKSWILNFNFHGYQECRIWLHTSLFHSRFWNLAHLMKRNAEKQLYVNHPPYRVWVLLPFSYAIAHAQMNKTPWTIRCFIDDQFRIWSDTYSRQPNETSENASHADLSVCIEKSSFLTS